MQNFNFLIRYFAFLFELIQLSLRFFVNYLGEIVAARKNTTAKIIAIRSTARHREFFGDIPSNFTPICQAEFELELSKKSCSLCQKFYAEPVDSPTDDVNESNFDDDNVNENTAILRKQTYPSTGITEKPFRLTCGHVFGAKCITLRFTPRAAGGLGENTCPTCRQVIYIVNILPGQKEYLYLWDHNGNFQERRHYTEECKEWLERKQSTPGYGRIRVRFGYGWLSSDPLPLLMGTSPDRNTVFQITYWEHQDWD